MTSSRRFDDSASDRVAGIAARLSRQIVLPLVHDDDFADEARVGAEQRVTQHFLDHTGSIGRHVAEIAEMARAARGIRGAMRALLRVQVLAGRRAIGARVDVHSVRAGVERPSARRES